MDPSPFGGLHASSWMRRMVEPQSPSSDVKVTVSPRTTPKEPLTTPQSAVSTPQKRAEEPASLDFRALLQRRLEDTRTQLKTPGMTQSVRWYLEAEIRRIEGKLEAGGVGEDHAPVKVKVEKPEAYTKPFCDFLTQNPTVFHAVDYFQKKLTDAGFKKVSACYD